MELLLGITIWIWWIISIALAAEWPVIVFDLTTGEESSYSASIQEFRNKVKSGAVKYDVPVLKPPPTKPESPTKLEFVLADLKTEGDKTITLAINVFDLYVVGYCDKYEGKDRARFFNTVPKSTRDVLFDGAEKGEIPYAGNYDQLERNAGQNRANIELGIYKLQSAVESVYGKVIKTKEEAKFLIIAIQMVSEAARFKYIEQQVVDVEVYGSYKPDPKALTLETNWQSISKAFNTPKGKEIKPPLELKDPDGKRWEVKMVETIVPDVGLLKYETGTATLQSLASQLAQLIRSILANDGELILKFSNRRAFPDYK